MVVGLSLDLLDELLDEGAEETAEVEVEPASENGAGGAERRRRRRRRARPFFAQVPIVGVTGPNGAGKTLLAAHDAICDMLGGRRVISTVGIEYTDPATGQVYSTEPLTSLGQLIQIRDATVLLDEIASIFPSSTSASGLPAEVLVLLQTARHRGVTIRWTAPAWLRAQKVLREVTQAAVSVNPVGRRGRDLWPEPWWSAVTVWDARSGKVDGVPERRLKRRVLLLRRSLSWGAFDTHADTPVIGQPDSGGVCVDCGGSRTRQKCSAERHELLGIAPPYVLGGTNE